MKKIKITPITSFVLVVSVALSVLFAGCSPAEIEEPDIFVMEFTMARTFHAPIKISLMGGALESTAELKAEIYSGAGGYEWGEVERVIEKDVAEETFLELYERVSALDFNQIFLSNWERSGLDGSSWELRVGLGSNISLSLWCPTDDTKERGLDEFVSICKSLLALSEIEIPEEELY